MTTPAPSLLQRQFAAPGEARRILGIASPLTLASLGSMSLAITDVVMMGWIGPMQLGAGAAVSDWYSIVFYLASGAAAAGAASLSSLIGAGRACRLRSVFIETLIATLVLGLLLSPLVWHAARLLGWLGIEESVLADASGYARWMTLALAPMLLFRVCQSYVSAAAHTRVVFMATVSAIPINIVGNGAFMFGWFGVSPMGMPGAGVSSFLVALFLAVVLVMAVLANDSFRQADPARPTMQGIRECLSTGIPIGVGNLAEYGVYLLSTVLMVGFGAVAVGAHAVALRLSGVLFAFPLGLSQAVTVRIALFAGAGQLQALEGVVRIAAVMGLVLCLVDVVVLYAFAEQIAGLFLDRGAATGGAMALAVTLLWILAPAEALSVAGTLAAAALRGLKDTRVPMLHSMFAHWGAGFPASICLGFGLGFGAVGYWTGLLVGASVGALLISRRLARRLNANRAHLGRSIRECAL